MIPPKIIESTSGERINPRYVDWLESEIDRFKKKLSQQRKTIDLHQEHSSRYYRDALDYIPEHEREE
jgi:cob(I)alamin adenosyltransferase